VTVQDRERQISSFSLGGVYIGGGGQENLSFGTVRSRIQPKGRGLHRFPTETMDLLRREKKSGNLPPFIGKSTTIISFAGERISKGKR